MRSRNASISRACGKQAFRSKMQPLMLARYFVVALLLLLCPPPAGWAAEPAGATVVLQLPPSMSPESVKALIGDLAAKGAQPATGPVDPPAADMPALMTGMRSA